MCATPPQHVAFDSGFWFASQPEKQGLQGVLERCIFLFLFTTKFILCSCEDEGARMHRTCLLSNVRSHHVTGNSRHTRKQAHNAHPVRTRHPSPSLPVPHPQHFNSSLVRPKNFTKTLHTRPTNARRILDHVCCICGPHAHASTMLTFPFVLQPASIRTKGMPTYCTLQRLHKPFSKEREKVPCMRTKRFLLAAPHVFVLLAGLTYMPAYAPPSRSPGRIRAELELSYVRLS